MIQQNLKNSYYLDYSIEWDNSGDRTFYTRKDGLSRLILSMKDLDVNTNNEHLAYSDVYGRVVVISGEAAQKKLAVKLIKGTIKGKRKEIF